MGCKLANTQKSEKKSSVRSIYSMFAKKLTASFFLYMKHKLGYILHNYYLAKRLIPIK